MRDEQRPGRVQAVEAALQPPGGQSAAAARSRVRARCIERKLATHRRVSGFASQVRIGVHLDEATRDAAANYDGCGGHVAARVGAEAGAREILAGCETLDAAGPDFVRDGLRMVARKGVRRPIELLSIRWD